MPIRKSVGAWRIAPAFDAAGSSGAGRAPAGWARLRVLGAAAVGLVLASGTGAAQDALPDASDFSARQLLEACDPTEVSAAGPTAEFCDGFIMGTGQLYLQLVRAGAIRPWACAEDAPDVTHIRRDFVAWAEANPDRLSESAVDGFWRAMAETYPCAPEVTGP